MHRWWPLIALLFASGNVFAGIEFELSDGEKDLAGGEVCFYQSDVSRQDFSPARYYFSGHKVRCFPANENLPRPAGRFLYFARHPAGYVSANRFMRYDEIPTPADCYQKLRVFVRPEATIDFSAFASETSAGYGVWVDDSEQTVGTFFPLVPGESTIRVPAGMTVVPLQTRAKKVSTVGEPLKLKAGDRHRLLRPSPTPGRGDVIAWVDSDDEGIRAMMAAGRSMSPLDFVLTASSGETFSPVTRPLHPGGYAGSLLIFKSVPVGRVAIRADGPSWSTDEIAVVVKEGTVVTASKGLRVRPAPLVP